jgi:acyl-CoA synthetase (AMP-forming)/AMP-acid ligase II
VPAYQSGIEVVVTPGDVLSRALSDRVRARICSHVVVAYGSTEASMSATAHAHEAAAVPQAVGFVTPGVNIQIIDETGTILPPGQEGRVRVRSEYAVDNYFGNPQASEAAFRDGWFYPGDLGMLSAEGMLFVTGRQESVLNLGGDKVNPEAIELMLSQCRGVTEAAVLALPNVFGINEVCAVLVTSEKIDADALQSYCEARIDRPFWPTKFVMVESLPRNEMGKIDRRRLSDLVKQKIAGPE